jgi:chromatin remodeling complex protein RSC6
MDFDEDFDEILQNLGQLKKNITVIQNQIKSLEGRVKREKIKQEKHKLKKKKTTSGFAKPSKISEELCEFLGKEKGATMARTEVTKYLHNYIKEHALQVESNKTLIIPDTNLKNLLHLDSDSEEAKEIHFFSLQKYMNQHFV